MNDSSPTIRILGLKNPSAVEAYFSSSLVDVAYVADLAEDSANVLLENIDIRDPKDREWITDILATALAECEEPEARIEFLIAPHP